MWWIDAFCLVREGLGFVANALVVFYALHTCYYVSEIDTQLRQILQLERNALLTKEGQEETRRLTRSARARRGRRGAGQDNPDAGRGDLDAGRGNLDAGRGNLDARQDNLDGVAPLLEEFR